MERAIRVRTVTKQVQRGVPLPHLREWRFFRMLTQIELGEKAGVTGATISYIESGTNDAAFKTVKKIAAALDIDVDTLRYQSPPQKQDIATTPATDDDEDDQER